MDSLNVICAWCLRIIRSDSPCGGHGICPACAARMVAEQAARHQMEARR